MIIAVVAILVAGSATGALVTGAFGKPSASSLLTGTNQPTTPLPSEPPGTPTPSQPPSTTQPPTPTQPPTTTGPPTTTQPKPPHTYPHQCPKNNNKGGNGNHYGWNKKPSRRGWSGGL